jgi:assimilatory nitrate reductase catalytic subunit
MGRSGPVKRARIVCTCTSVTDVAINEALSRGLDLEALKTTLKCGITCGSCLPEVRRMAAERTAATEATP